jgi:hypothetical protein
MFSPNYHCVLCSVAYEEDIDHLLFTCSFAVSCWQKLGIQLVHTADIHA